MTISLFSPPDLVHPSQEVLENWSSDISNGVKGIGVKMELITLPTGLDNFLVSPINRPSYYLPEMVMGKTGYDDGGLFVGILSKNGFSNGHSRDLVEVPVTNFGKSVFI